MEVLEARGGVEPPIKVLQTYLGVLSQFVHGGKCLLHQGLSRMASKGL
jgi:hypothetical protein